MSAHWFDLERGLHQACVLASLLFNIPFIAVMVIALQRVEADPEFVSNMVLITRGARAVGETAFG